MDRQQRFLHKVLHLVRPTAQPAAQECPQMRGGGLKEAPIRLLVAVEPLQEQRVQPQFRTVMVLHQGYSLHRCL